MGRSIDRLNFAVEAFLKGGGKITKYSVGTEKMQGEAERLHFHQTRQHDHEGSAAFVERAATKRKGKLLSRADMLRLDD